MQYDPKNKEHREELAHQILNTLARAGFEKVEKEKTYEAVYGRLVESESRRLRVIVYTTIEPYRVSGFAVRHKDRDAIRVQVEYLNKHGQTKCISSGVKVLRTGEVDAICERLLSRMRSSYKYGMSPDTCIVCGAPTFTSKAGRQVCGDICWDPDAGSRSESALNDELKGFQDFSMG